MRPRSPALVVAAVAPASLLAVDPGGWYPFGPVKWLAVSVLVAAGGALVLARRPLRVAVVPTAAALALTGWLALAAALGRDPLYAWVGTPERHFGVLTWALCTLALVVGQSLEDADGRTVAAGLVVAGVGVGAVAAAEGLGWEPSELDVADRLSGTLGSPAYLGAAAALLLPALGGLAADAGWDRRWRVAAGAGAAGLAVAALGSGARAAWVGLVAAAVVVAWAHRNELAVRRRAARAHSDDRVAGLRAPWAARAGAVLGAVVLATAVVAGPVGARAADVFDADAPGGRGRLDEWRVAARVVAANPLAGVGPEGYRVAFAEGVDERYQRRHGRDPQPDRAHSTPLDVALAGGLPALAAWLVLAAAAGRAAYAALRDRRRWLSGVAAGLVAYGIGGLFLFPLAELAPVAWLLAGIVIGATARQRQSATRMVTVAVGPAVPAALAVLALLGLVAGVADVVADHHARHAVDALAEGDGTVAAHEARAATRLRPDQVRLHLLDARARVADDQGLLAGIRAVDRALDLSPGDPVARRARARLLVARAAATRAPQVIDEARAVLADHLADDPLDAEVWRLAAIAARLDGDGGAAARAEATADGLAATGRRGT